jgi:hypothetical protein
MTREGGPTPEELARTYERLPDVELETLAWQPEALVPAAHDVLAEEIYRRGLTVAYTFPTSEETAAALAEQRQARRARVLGGLLVLGVFYAVQYLGREWRSGEEIDLGSRHFWGYFAALILGNAALFGLLYLAWRAVRYGLDRIGYGRARRLR